MGLSTVVFRAAPLILGADLSFIMEFQSSKMVPIAGPAHNGGTKMWLESISPGMRTVEAVLRELSQNDVPVLIVAEHGSGKAAAAARIHSLSRRASEPFQAYQCRDASDQVLEDARDRAGRFTFRKSAI